MTYEVHGQLFFASVQDFTDQLDFNADVSHVILDLSNTQLWDDSAVGAIDKVKHKYGLRNIEVSITGLNKESYKLMEKIGGLNKASGH
jgi:SulP family sulfate permease